MQDLFSLFVAIDSWLYRMFGCMVLSRQNLYDDSRQSQRIPAAPKTELLFRSGGVVQLSVHKISAETIRFRQQFKIKAFCFFNVAKKILLRLIHDSHLQPEFRLSIALMDFNGHSTFFAIFLKSLKTTTAEKRMPYRGEPFEK